MLCRRCGTMITLVYGDEEYHPLCDPSPHTWTLAQIDEWTARAQERAARR